MPPLLLALALASASPCPAAAIPDPAPLAAQAAGLDPHVLDLALHAFETARCEGDAKRDVLAVIDYSKPSTEKRLWVFDLARRKLLFHELVAHGKNSGGDDARVFSNSPRSLDSSLGVFVTGAAYVGGHGLSLVLNGLERGVNDLARARAVVLHGAAYVSQAFARAHGRLGRSWGCPAVRTAVAPKMVRALEDGAVLFAYYPDRQWLASSRFLK